MVSRRNLFLVSAGSLLLVSANLRAPLPHHPHDIISAFAASPGYPDDPRLFVASPGSINVVLTSEDHGDTWTEARAGLRGHRVTAIELSSDWTTSGRMYAAMRDVGLQRSEDHGRTWLPPLIERPLRYLAVAPVGPDDTRVLFMATRTEVFRSDDDGESDRRLDVPLSGHHVVALDVSPTFATDGTIAVAGGPNLYLSGDGGESWDMITPPASVRQIAFSPAYADDGVLWVATWGQGVCRSTDRGQTFEPCGAGLTDREVNQVAVAKTGDSLELFAATREAGVFHSEDGGENWRLTSLEVDKTYQTTNHHTILRVSPGWPEDRSIWCGCFEGLHLSRDGGATWRESQINPTRMGRLLNISPNYAKDRTVFAAGYGMHLLVTKNGGESWNLQWTDMHSGSLYSIGVSPNFERDRLLIAGTGRGVRRSYNAGRTWQKIPFFSHLDQHTPDGSGGYTIKSVVFAPGFSKNRTVFAVSSRGVLYRSEDAGLHWGLSRPFAEWTSTVALSSEFESDSTLFVSGRNVYRSTDAGHTFSAPLLEDEVLDNGLIVPPDFGKTGELYCITTNRGFVRLEQRGESWTVANSGLERFGPSAIQISPAFLDDGTLFLTTVGGGVFRSSDRGRSWQRVSPVRSPVDHGICMIISPNFADDQTLFVGTFDGFCRSTDGGRSWELVTDTEYYDDLRDPWRKIGSWRAQTIGGAINRTVSISSTVGDRMVLPFNGKEVRVIGPRGPGMGRAKVYLDDELRTTVDCHADTLAQRQVLAEIVGLDGRAHTLEVRVDGEQEGAPAKVVGIDAVEVVYR